MASLTKALASVIPHPLRTCAACIEILEGSKPHIVRRSPSLRHQGQSAWRQVDPTAGRHAEAQWQSVHGNDPTAPGAYLLLNWQGRARCMRINELQRPVRLLPRPGPQVDELGRRVKQGDLVDEGHQVGVLLV